MRALPPAEAAAALGSPGCRIRVRSVPIRTATGACCTTVVSKRAHPSGGTAAAACGNVTMETAGDAARAEEALSLLAQFEPDSEGGGALDVPLHARGSRADTVAWVIWDDVESELAWVTDQLARIMPRAAPAAGPPRSHATR